MKRSSLIVISLGLFLVSGLLLFNLFKQIVYPPSDPVIPGCSTCPTVNYNTKEPDLVDIDIFIVPDSKTSDLIHVNYLDSQLQNYSQTQVEYALGGKPLKAIMISPDSISHRQISENGSNQEYSFNGSFKLGDDQVEFTIPQLYMHMVIRAGQDIGKYGGIASDAQVTINGKVIPAHVAVTLGIFNKFVPVDIAAQKVRTDWLMYFDENWNFYHLDKTIVDNPTIDYYSHSFLSEIESSSGNVSYLREFSLSKLEPLTLSLRSTHGSNTVGQVFTIEDTVVPYHAAQLSKLTGSNGGIGVYININNGTTN